MALPYILSLFQSPHFCFFQFVFFFSFVKTQSFSTIKAFTAVSFMTDIIFPLTKINIILTHVWFGAQKAHGFVFRFGNSAIRKIARFFFLSRKLFETNH